MRLGDHCLLWFLTGDQCAMRLALVLVLLALCGVPAVANTSPGLYRTLSDDTFQLRRVVAVELKRRVSERVLETIADVIKRQNNQKFERTIISYYLPQMSRGGTSWATAVFAPELAIAIHGLRVEEQLRFEEAFKKDKRKLVGGWLTAAPASPGKLVIFTKKRRKFAEWSLRDGRITTKALVETRTWRGRRFDVKGADETYFLVTQAGDLEIRTMSGLVAHAEKMGRRVPYRRPLVAGVVHELSDQAAAYWVDNSQAPSSSDVGSQPAAAPVGKTLNVVRATPAEIATAPRPVPALRPAVGAQGQQVVAGRDAKKSVARRKKRRAEPTVADLIMAHMLNQ